MENTVKYLQLDTLEEIVFKNCDSNSFIGFTTVKNTDLHGNEYELKLREEKYFLISKIDNTSVFISENKLLNTLLSDYIQHIESGEIYEHGYPEGRLIPSNHCEQRQIMLLEEVKDKISIKIEDILEYYFQKGEFDE